MPTRGRIQRTIIILAVLGVSAAITVSAHMRFSTGLDRAAQDRAMQDKAAIDRLHQLDIQTTLADKADELAKLWDADAVRILPGIPAEIGKAVIYANDRREESRNGGGQTVCYSPEIKDLQLAGDWAFEWGYFSYRNAREPKPMRGKVMRVMKRQADGSWKFARVMVLPEPLESAAPMAHPCQ
jgi:hypothetical protein